MPLGSPRTRSPRLARAAALTAAGLAATMLLAACGSSDGDTGTGEASGTLTIYSGRSESLVQPIIDQFSEETGVSVEVRYGDTSGMAAQLIEEGDRTPADVFLAQDAGALGAVAQEGLFAPIAAEITAQVPEQYRDSADQWVGLTGRARVMVYDPAQVDEADLPVSVYELTAPEWEGKVAIAPPNASFQSFVTGMRVADGEQTAQDWLDDMVANDVQSYDKNGPILAAVEAGEVPLGLINHYYWYEEVAEVGAENVSSLLAYTEAGDPGSLVNVSGIGILTGSADDPNATALVEYLLGDTGQTYFAEETLEYPLIDSVPPAADLPPLDSLQGPAIDLGDLSSLSQTVAMLQEAGLL